MSTFQQTIVPVKGGKIHFQISMWTVEGPSSMRTHTGYRLSEHFAAERAFGSWSITHLPSGLHVTGATRKTLKESRAVAQRLERFDCDWSRFHRYARTTKHRLARNLVSAGVLRPFQGIG